jgi:enoyl-CoA hydratase
MHAPHAQDAEIICEKQGRTGLVTLNRPKALNALTLTMVRDLTAALDRWETDPEVENIVVTAAGERAFCAGGDIRQIHDCGKNGQKDAAITFWREEYQLNDRIKTYPKPYLALIDGIVMGGGVGITLHGRYRVAGDRFLFAMPEVGIGLFPDVGGSYALPRLPGMSGMWLALTGARIGRADALALGIATHGVPSSAFPAIVAALADGVDIEETLRHHAAPSEPAMPEETRVVIASCFSGESLGEILGRLDEAGFTHDFAAQAAATIRTKSPTSLALTFEQLRRGRTLDFADCMRLEYRMVSRILDGHDFYEGVRAAVIDKDQTPHWSPARLEDVSQDVVQSYFAPLAQELPLAER